MPDETIYITELDTALLRVFIDNKILDNATIIKTLNSLIEKVLR